jgi:hypothetical protein
MEAPNADTLGQHFLKLGASTEEIVRMIRSFNGYSDAFRIASEKFEESIR